jgi:hypothetical protein
MLEEMSSSTGIKDIEGNEVEFSSRESGAAPQRSGEDRKQVHEADPKFIDALGELHNTRRGRVYDTAGTVLLEVPIRELIQKIQDAENADVIVFDGIITQRLIELANKNGVRAIYGIRAGQVSRSFDNMLLYTKEQGTIGR